jgi:phosphatidylserine/phosphatidylglycerophosphate/cardiolipin synthase-like enzyme
VHVWIDRGVRIAHAKAMVIDDAVTLMGSMNWTASAGRNSEDLNLIASITLATLAAPYGFAHSAGA